MAVMTRIKTAWNAFVSVESSWDAPANSGGYTTSFQPQRSRLYHFNDRTIVTSILTRMSIDASGVPFKHVKVDEDGRYQEDMKSALQSALTLEANLDQGPRAFRQDAAMTLLEKGAIAIVPVDTSMNPQKHERFDIYTIRVGEIVAWFPRHVRVKLYNEALGEAQEITLEKRFVAIVYNPLYAVMNESSSTLQRLIRKLSILDAIDEQSGSGKLDLIIQLPYVIKSQARRDAADKRRSDMEEQLQGSKYGIAYADSTEKITQLNRPAENNLLSQIEYLTEMLYSELGVTKDVMNGTADEKTMLNYLNRSIEPVLDAIVEGMQRSFLGPMGTLAQERIMYFRDPFKLVPISEIAEIADKFARNEITSSNELRQAIGMKPSKDPKADELVNSNMPQQPSNVEVPTLREDSQNGS